MPCRVQGNRYTVAVARAFDGLTGRKSQGIGDVHKVRATMFRASCVLWFVKRNSKQ